MRLWKNNRLDAEYEMTPDEVAEAFLASTYAQIAMPLERLLTIFIGAPDGLESSWDPAEQRAEFDAVFEATVERRAS